MSNMKRLLEEYPLNHIPRMVWEGELYPFRKICSMDMINEASQGIKLTTMPYACFSVKLQEITFDAIQQALEKAYLTMRANPAYLFCSEDDRKLFVMKADPRDPEEPAKEIAQLVNQTTGKLMHIVTLPKLEDGTLLFGFFTY